MTDEIYFPNLPLSYLRKLSKNRFRGFNQASQLFFPKEDYPMTVVETSVSISKPVKEVFAFLSDLNNQTKLNDTLSEVVLSGPVAVGTKFKLKGSVMGRDFDTDNEIIALEQDKVFGMKTFAAPPASDITNTYTFESEGDGTKLTLAMDSVIMTGGVPGMEDMVKGQLKSGLETSMAAIKKALEG